jgi:CheY-like chemotaxis protein
VTTSWRRLSDKSQTYSGPSRGHDGVRARSSQQNSAEQVAAWESEGGSTTFPQQPTSVLIVDNDITSADSLEHMLRTAGYPAVRVAYSGHAALALAAESAPNLVLLELDLLDMNGYDLARSLRGRAQSDPMRVVALTSDREYSGSNLARAAGIEGYLLEPVSPPALSEFLESSSRYHAT